MDPHLVVRAFGRDRHLDAVPAVRAGVDEQVLEGLAERVGIGPQQQGGDLSDLGLEAGQHPPGALDGLADEVS